MGSSRIVKTLGCAFKTGDLFRNFDYKKTGLTKEHYRGWTHLRYVSQMFRECLKLVINDIIDRDVAFWLPLTGARKSRMRMNRTSGEAFKRARKAGVWSEVDILASNFSGYRIVLDMLGNGVPTQRRVYLNYDYKQRIIKNTNAGKPYGGGCIETTLNDYIPKMQELYPDVTKTDLKKILNFAWKSLYLHISYGGDVCVQGAGFRCYFGLYMGNRLQRFQDYIKKLTVRIRIGYKKHGSPWDGYYYFGLNDKAYQNYLSQNKRMGERKKIYNFGCVTLYQIYDECRINEYGKRYIFRVPFVTTLGLRLILNDFTGRGELIQVRNPLKYRDVLTFYNDYEFL